MELNFSFTGQTSYNFSSSIDVILYLQSTTFHEFYGSIPATFNQQGDLNLSEVLNFFFTEKLLSKQKPLYYFDYLENIYVYFSHLLEGPDIWISNQSLNQERSKLTLHLLYKDLNQESQIEIQQNDQRNEPEISIDEFEKSNQINFELSTQLGQTHNKNDSTRSDEDLEADDSEVLVNGAKKRHSQRKIHEAIDLVTKWRNLYKGYQDPRTGAFVKYSLLEAAEKLGIPKKSLDDYLLMIGHGKKLGFDFKANREKGFGVLRQFVKKNKLKSS